MMHTHAQSCCGGAPRADQGDSRSAPRHDSPRFEPRIDVVETPAEFVARLDVPGAASESIEIDLSEGVLTVRAAVEPRAPAQARWLRREYNVGAFERRLRIGETVDPTAIAAEFADGALTIRLPKRPEVTPRKVPVRTIA